MRAATKSKSAAIRERLKHPVIDCDGHFIEVMPVFFEYMRNIGGPNILKKYGVRNESDIERVGMGFDLSMGFGLTLEERRERRIVRPQFWGLPTGSTLD